MRTMWQFPSLLAVSAVHHHLIETKESTSVKYYLREWVNQEKYIIICSRWWWKDKSDLPSE